MKRFLWICLMALLLVSCGGSQQEQPQSQQPSVSGFKMPDSPTIAGIYDTPAGAYIGVWTYQTNCGESHGGLGSHDIRGVIQFKDNGQFEMGFMTVQGNSLVYQAKRDGYWALTDGTYVTMAVAHELNTNMEITVVNPKASLKVYFKLENGKGSYLDEYQRSMDFRKKSPGGTKLENLKRI